MKSKINHIPMLVFSIILLAVVSVTYIYVSDTVASLTTKILSARNEAVDLEASRLQNKTIATLYENSSDMRARLNSYFVLAKDAISLVEAIENLEKVTRNKVTVVSIDDKDPKVVTVHASSQGSWISVMKTLKLVENLPFATSIGRVGLDTSVLGKSTDKRTWSLTFDIHAPLI